MQRLFSHQISQLLQTNYYKVWMYFCFNAKIIFLLKEQIHFDMLLETMSSFLRIVTMLCGVFSSFFLQFFDVILQ
jgi:hypothetical protein